MYVKELCQVHMYTKYQVDILKNDRVLVFARSKTAFFTLLPTISVLSRFSEFVGFCPLKKCCRVIFSRS